ncbi:hypothetical protein ACP4OV_002318 [Aristida adscensionis]
MVALKVQDGQREELLPEEELRFEAVADEREELPTEDVDVEADEAQERDELLVELLLEVYHVMETKHGEVRRLVAEKEAAQGGAAAADRRLADVGRAQKVFDLGIDKALKAYKAKEAESAELRLQLVALGVQPPEPPELVRTHPEHFLPGRRRA